MLGREHEGDLEREALKRRRAAEIGEREGRDRGFRVRARRGTVFVPSSATTSRIVEGPFPSSSCGIEGTEIDTGTFTYMSRPEDTGE